MDKTKIETQELWYAFFPYEENPGIKKKRPVIVLSTDNEHVIILAIKVTSHGPRNKDPFDIRILDWESAGLPKPSVARISKMKYLLQIDFANKIGTLSKRDWKNLENTVKRFVKQKLTSKNDQK